MDFTLDLINGMVFGIEFVSKNLDRDIDESCVIIEFACLRGILWLGDFDE